MNSRIHALRQAHSMSRSELAAHMQVDWSTVWRWETQGKIPEVEKILKLAKLFGVPALELAMDLAPELAALLEPVED